MGPKSLKRRFRQRYGNGALALICLVVFGGMVGLAYAAVPFYRAFCAATGFNGTPRRVQVSTAGKVLSRTLSVRFDTNVRKLPWTFTPVVTHQTIHIGATNLAYFKVKNEGAIPITGRAAYNVSPEISGDLLPEDPVLLLTTIRPSRPASRRPSP